MQEGNGEERAMVVPTGLGFHIKVADMGRSLRFYTALGLKPVFAYGDDEFRSSLPAGTPSAPERYRGVTLRAGETDFEIAEGHIAVPSRSVYEATIESPKVSAMLRVESLVPVLSLPSVEIKFPVRHYYWGTIEAAFRDPDGFVVIAIAPFSEGELAAVSELVPVETISPS